MTRFVGLDVSQKMTAICVVDNAGRTFSSYLYGYRNLVECFFNKNKHYRAVATRYDKTPENFLAGVKLASLRIWTHFNESITYIFSPECEVHRPSSRAERFRLVSRAVPARPGSLPIVWTSRRPNK